MKRQPLLSLLRSYGIRYPDEKTNVLKMIAFLESSENCFERDNPEGHFTGSAWVVNPSRGAVLLTHHRKLNKWLQLGGHADGNSDLQVVAREEAMEESGIQSLKLVSNEIFDLDIHPIPPLGTDSAHLHYDVRFLFEADPDLGKVVVSPESHDVAWVPIEKVTQLNQEPSMARMVEKTRNGFI